jgi:hypothetical protein
MVMSKGLKLNDSYSSKDFNYLITTGFTTSTNCYLYLFTSKEKLVTNVKSIIRKMHKNENSSDLEITRSGACMASKLHSLLLIT